MDFWELFRAVKCGRLSAVVNADGYYVLHWRGIGIVSDDEALRLVEEWNAKICDGLRAEAARVVLEMFPSAGVPN